MTDAKGGRTTYGYDNVGNRTLVQDPIKTASADPDDFTTKTAYDLDHRQTTVTDAIGKTTRTEYDKDGLAVAAIDQDGNRTETVFDPRGKVSEVRSPHQSGVTRITRFEYDQVGNQTKVTSPRGVETSTEPNDFAQTTAYYADNRVKEVRLPYDPKDPRYNTPDKVTYEYDDAGRLTTVSAPPSQGQSVRNNTLLDYYDNGWVKTSTDPWDIVTSYDYNELGEQTRRTLTSAGGSADRTMTWDYYPDGKAKLRTDDGVPVGRHVVLVDNSDAQNIDTTGTWTTSNAGTSFQGFDYRTHQAGTGTDTFTWTLNVPQAGTYEVFVRYPAVAGAATDAPFKVDFEGGSTTKTVNQTTQAGQWVSLGSYGFSEGNTHKVTLTPSTSGTVVADAVKLVRDNSGDVDNETKHITNTYDPNGNLTSIADVSSGALVDSYALTYDGLNRLETVQEKAGPSVRNTTSYTYYPNSNPFTRTHDRQNATYEYDARNLLAKATITEPGMAAKVTTFGYTSRGERQTQTNGHGNTVEYTYYLDGPLRTQTERKADGALVASHDIDYDANSNRTRDATKTQNADNHAAYLDNTYTYTYDPRDRIAQVTRTPASGTASTEKYIHDANDNVISKTVGGTTSTLVYDRNRLQTATVGNATARYNYDPFGRLDTVTQAGAVVERYRYDGFDRVSEHFVGGTKPSTTRYTYDPLDRTATRTDKAGTAQQKITAFDYLGTTGDVLAEEVAGQVQRTYQHGPLGERLSMVKFAAGAPEASSYYVYNTHSDVEAITDESGATRATYGYTAYGADLFTGVDKPDSANPDKEPYNVYRYNAKQVEPGTGTYDMGFRDYDPNLSRFITRDMYNGALDDVGLAIDPFTMNRYAFGGANPIGAIEYDGHCWDWLCDSVGGWVNGAIDGITDPFRDWFANSAGGAAAAGCPAQMYQACTGAQDTVRDTIKDKTDTPRVPIGNPDHATYKVSHFIGEVTGPPLPGAAAGEGPRLLTRAPRLISGLSRFATRLFAGKAAEGEVVPILRYPGKSLPDSAGNMARYMGDHGMDETSTFTRVTPKERDANRAANKPLYTGDPSMEEFPFASTAEGGPGAYLTQVSIDEQRAQGRLLSAFYHWNGIKPGDPFGIWIDWTY